MIKFARIENEETKLCSVIDIGNATKEFIEANNYTKQDVSLSDIDDSWYLTPYCKMKTDEEKAQEETERIAKLNLTRGDVFRGIYQAKQISRADLREMIVRNETVSMFQKELALIDFDEALNFFRGNPLIDIMGASIGLTKEQLDRFFETNDYHELETVEPEPTETPTEAPKEVK